jgi:superfamily II DNA or RNA helicase
MSDWDTDYLSLVSIAAQADSFSNYLYKTKVDKHLVPRIIDNLTLKLQPVLEETLLHSAALDACVGYFNLRGWASLVDAIDQLPTVPNRPPVRLIIGMRQVDPEHELRDQLRLAKRQEVMDQATAKRLQELAAADLRSQLSWGVPTATAESTLRNLRRQLMGGQVRVKLFLRHNLHAKLYLCHRNDPVNPRVGFVGSSNLTFSGLGGQGELNVDVMDQDSTEKLHSWFEARWSDRFSIDITDELIQIIGESWAADRVIKPYLIHLKLAYHLSRDARAGLVEFGLPESMQKKLLAYQSAAVKITARNLMSRNGAVLGDVVGLGKTIVATAVALLLQEEQGFETLIVCPKNLVTMWEGYIEAYRLHAKVVSLSTVHKDLPDMRRYRLVIVDESHNLRNRKRRDYVTIRDYISLNDPKVLLLTATPYNTSMNDVASQLGLFIDEDEDLGIRPEAAIKRIGEIEFLGKCDDKPSTLRAFRVSEETEDWQRLLSRVLIRRTRRFIKENYAVLDPSNNRYYLVFGNGDRNYLPDRVPLPLPFETSNSDPASDMESENVLRAIDELILPRYQMGTYLNPLGPVPNEGEKSFVADLKTAQGNLLGFTRTMLMKRLASNGAVFMLSLQRHLLRNYLYLAALEQGTELPVGSVTDSQIFLDKEDGLAIDIDLKDDGFNEVMTPEEWKALGSKALSDLMVRSPKSVLWVRPALFTADLRVALERDTTVIGNLLSRFGIWDQARDSKLDALQELLEKKHPHEKVLVFSEYADTAEYVVSALNKRGVSKVAAVTGDNDDPTKLARRFSPQSNVDLPGPAIRPEEEIRILVATDVLSEGQNLQDSAIVVNFDLPWAIIKLIQRAGRVDRIGQKAPKVLVYTFLPTGGVESVLRLRERVAQRLAKNAAVLGADEKFLNTEGESQLIKGLFDETSDLSEGDETAEVDYASAAYEIWRRAEENNPEVAQAAIDLPDVTFATRAAPITGSNTAQSDGVLVYTLSQHGFDRIGLATRSGESRIVGPHEALTLTACEPTEAGLVRLPDHYDLVEAIISGPLAADEFNAEGQLSGVRRRVYERIRILVSEESEHLHTSGIEAHDAVDALYKSPLTEYSKQLLARAMRDRSSEDVLALVASLHREGRLTIASVAHEDEIRIVCSMGFIDPRAQQ